MSASTFRIPRLTAAVLLLGGACSEDTTREKDAGTGDGDHGDGDRGDGDGDGDGDVKVDGSGKVDGNGDGGVTGDGDGDGDGDAPGDGDSTGDGDGDSGPVNTAGVDVSAARVSRVAGAYCNEYAECEADYFDYAFDSLAECVSDVSVYFSEYVTSYGRECADAIFDLVECEATLDCNDQDENACATEDAAAVKVCPDEDTKARKKARGLRIPR